MATLDVSSKAIIDTPLDEQFDLLRDICRTHPANNESGIIIKDSHIGHYHHRTTPPVSPHIQPFIYTHQDTDTPTLPPPIHSLHNTITHKLQPINYNINGNYNQHRKSAHRF